MKTTDFIINRVRYRCIKTSDIKVNDFIIYKYSMPKKLKLYKIYYITDLDIFSKEFNKLNMFLDKKYSRINIPTHILYEKFKDYEDIIFDKPLPVLFKKEFYKVIKMIKDYT